MIERTIKNILISQPEPTDLLKNQYKALSSKYEVEFTFYKFFDVVGISNREFRDAKISILDHSAVIFTSKLSVDNYFRLAKELRLTIPETMKYFCITETVANYMQNYVQYRKRKIFYGKLTFKDLVDVIAKHKEEKFIIPCAEDSSIDYFNMLDAAKIKYTKAVMYRSEPKDLTNIDIKKFDMIAMFSPIGVKSFVQSFPQITSEDIFIAAFGTTTQTALKSAKLKTYIPAPTKEAPSMIMAIDKFLSLTTEERKEWMEVIDAEFKVKKKPATTKKTTTKKATTTKKTATAKKTTATKSTTTKKTTTAKKTSKTKDE
ncbi:MAG: uroporphyrinogen-III synthase [Bacteroidales bacterium]|jgi:uroporphyrinogen-III synthase|nr:uroporphyrinogen-III synthase [Bacteroidales bacterium]MEE1252668.1 uroporphyrinogen-III synthase [Bacteroidales bacterium]MEE1271806.1 uroporphyrinogen-III synthase [Bacteroidales bacterium]